MYSQRYSIPDEAVFDVNDDGEIVGDGVVIVKEPNDIDTVIIREIDTIAVMSVEVAEASIEQLQNMYVKDLEITIKRINELKEDEDEDEYGEITVPTEHAIQKAIELASESAKLLPERFTKAWVSTEHSGGIRLTWAKVGLNKEVRLIVPPTANKQTCLYHEIDDEYGVEYNVSAKTLSTWLSWFNK